MKYPVFDTRYALRQIGEDLFYLMDPVTGDYYELSLEQFLTFYLSTGENSLADIQNAVKVPMKDIEEFVDEQAADGFLKISDSKTEKADIHYRKSSEPHFSDVLIEITGKCNLYCKHCFNSKFNSEECAEETMTKAQILNLIEELDRLNVRRIQLSGGEPLLREDIWDIIDAIDEHKIFLDVISTNATLITPESAEKFGERFRENGALYISLDGISEETYEGLRGEGTFSLIMNALDLLEEAGCRVFINTMAYKGNLHEIEKMYDWIKSRKNIVGWRIGLPKVLGRYEENHEHLEVGFDEVISVFKKLIIRWLDERPELRLELSDFFRTDSFETGFEDHQLDDSPCKYAMTNASIKPDGKVVFCASMEIFEPANLGYALQEGLENVWYGERHMNYRKLKIRDLDKCAECRYVRICGGGCRSNALLSYGSLYAEDPRACTAMKMLEEEIMPMLPEDVRIQIDNLIDKDKSFSLPTGYVKYI